MKKIAIFLLFCLFCAPAWAQDEAIEGVDKAFFPLQSVLRNLELKPEQRSRICSEALTSLARVNQLRAEIGNMQLEEACLKLSDQVDSAKLKDLYRRRGELEAEIYLARQEYMKSLKSILTEEQLRQLEQRRDLSRQNREPKVKP